MNMYMYTCDKDHVACCFKTYEEMNYVCPCGVPMKPVLLAKIDEEVDEINKQFTQAETVTDHEHIVDALKYSLWPTPSEQFNLFDPTWVYHNKEALQDDIDKVHKAICDHEFVEYVGLIDRYSYCKHCDVKNK